MFNPISVQHKGAGEKKKIMGHMKFQDSRLSNIPFLKFDFDLLVSQLPDILQNFFCTPEGAMDLTFQIKYIPRRFVFHLMERLSITQITLFF